jgi:L-malate glycosyltransferase
MKLEPRKEKYVHLQYGIDLVEPEHKENIIYSNRLHQKLYRIDQIIIYMDEFRKQYPDWKLVIGAVGRETERLKEDVQTRGMEDCVEFVGWLEKKDNHAWYAKASIYISIPQHDGTAVSLLEAMSAGCVPVVPDLAVSREWIEDGVNGIIEKPGKNPLLEAVHFDRDRCVVKNRERIEKEASREVCTARFIEIYKVLTTALACWY